MERETLQKERSKTTKLRGGAKSESEKERKLEKLLKKSRSILKNKKYQIHDVRLIEKQIGSIENLEKHLFRKNNLIFENTPQSIKNKK